MTLLQAVSDQLLSMASSPSFNNLSLGLAVTATAAGTTTLTVASAGQQLFTGTTTQTVVLPVVSTLTTGWQFIIINRSTGNVTVESSGGNTIQVMASNTSLVVIYNGTAGTGTASWDSRYTVSNSAIAETFDGDSGSATPSSGTITISGGSTGLTTSASSATVSLTGTLNIGNGGTGTATAPTAGQILIGTSGGAYTPAAIGSGTNILVQNSSGAITVGITGQIAAANGGTGLSSLGTGVATALGHNVTGSGGIALATSPTFVTPTLGAASATSINFGGSTLSTYVTAGTFAPTITFSTPGDLSISYSTQSGFYTRIGNIVHLDFIIVFTPTYTTAANFFIIGNFPYNTISTSGYSPSGNLLTEGIIFPAGTTSLSTTGSNNSNFVEVYGSGTSVTGALLTATNVPSGTQYVVEGSLTYLAA